MRSGTKNKKQAPPRPRGRPREFDPDQVLDRVRDVFIEKGFAAASLDDLAAAAGLNRPSLYAAFGDKEQLYIASLRRYGSQIAMALQAILSRTEPIERRLAAMYSAAVKLYTAPPRPSGCMIIGTAATEAPTHPKIAATAVALLAAIETILEGAFDEAVNQGELAADPSPATRARLAGAIFDTLAIRARFGSTAMDLEAFAHAMIPALCK